MEVGDQNVAHLRTGKSRWHGLNIKPIKLINTSLYMSGLRPIGRVLSVGNIMHLLHLHYTVATSLGGAKRILDLTYRMPPLYAFTIISTLLLIRQNTTNGK